MKVKKVKPLNIIDYLLDEDVILGFMNETENSGNKELIEEARAMVERARERITKTGG